MESSTGSEQAPAGSAGSLELSKDFWDWMVFRGWLWTPHELKPFLSFRWLQDDNFTWCDVDFPKLLTAGYVRRLNNEVWEFTALGREQLLPQIRAYAVLLKLKGKTAR